MSTTLAVRSSGWLTARRVRVHGVLLALGIWSIFAWNFATPGLRDRHGLLKGTDFLHFYSIGSLALHRQGAELYDMRAQAALASKLVPEAAGITYLPLYGPQVSLLFAPLATLPYGWALAAWLALSSIIYGLCCYAVWKLCPHLQSEAITVAILAIAYPALFHLLVWGQTSALALVCFTLAFLALHSGRPFLAGLALGLLILKPQLGIAAAFVFLFGGEWKIILGAAVSAIAELSVGWIYYGAAVMRDYVHHLLHVREVLSLLEPRPYQLHSLRGFWSLLFPWTSTAFALYALTGLAVLLAAALFWRARSDLGLRYSALLLATVLVAPHLTVYDLTILAPAFLLTADWLIGHPENRLSPAIAVLIYLGYGLPLLAPLTRWTHVQLSTVALTLLLFVMIYAANVEDVQQPSGAALTQSAP
jgi:arabinofuranan 3-O-arabinosyltransferase